MSQKIMSRIPEYLDLCGITKDDAGWGLQYNLIFASISTRVLRHGCAPKVAEFLEGMGAVHCVKPVPTEGRLARLVFGVVGLAHAFIKKFESFQEHI
jgi:hypothetical protein